MRSALLGLAGVLAVAVAVLPARAQAVPTRLLNPTSDDVWTQQMAFQFGRNFMNLTGGEPVIFLNVRSVGLANCNVPPHTTTATGKTPRELVAELIADGARVFLRGGCTEQAGLALDDRIAGVEPAGPERHRLLAAPRTKVMSYEFSGRRN